MVRRVADRCTRCRQCLCLILFASRASLRDRHGQIEEDAEGEEEGTVVGGNVDGRVVCPTDSGDVRVGLRVHTGRPSSRSMSQTGTNTTPSRTPSLPRYVRNTTVIERVCTLQACSHCCACHLRHSQNGYGRCMKTATAAWPDCECAGGCTAGRCAQPECASNRVVVTTDVDSDSDSDSQSTVILPATESQQPHDDHRSPDVRAVSHSSHPSPLSGVRRAVDGVHVDEEVCVGPQADTHASSAAAYR